MSSPSQILVSSSQFNSTLDVALSEYKKQTGNDLLDSWLAKELQNCDSVDAILEIIQQQAEAFDQVRKGDKKLMKWIGSSVRVLYKVSVTLSEGASVVLPSAKAVFAGFGVLLAVVKGVSATHDVLVDLFERIQIFLKRLGVHTRISPTKEMVEILVKIVAEVLSILSIATKEIRQSRTGAYLKYLVGRTDIEDSLKRLDNLTQEEVLIAIAQVPKGINVLKDAKKTNENMQQIANVGQIEWNQIERSVRKWLSPPDPSTNYNIGYSCYHEGTSSWFFKGSVFNEWMSNGLLLWIYGKPGSGKSVLCSAIIKHVMSLRDAGHASLAYFYFDFRDVEKRTTRNFVTSLLTQLAARSERCHNIISRLYSTHQNGAQRPSFDVLANCLYEMLFVAAQLPIYVIVDGLDECLTLSASGSLSSQKEVLRLLKDLVDMRVPNLHICVTSRPEIEIRIVLEPLADRVVSLHDESGQLKDVHDYVSNVVYSDRNMRKWRDDDKMLVVNALAEKSDGMFRWAFCQLEVLRHRTPASIRQALDKLPGTLDETYARVLREIPKARQAHAHRILQCLMVAVRPLRIEELAEVLAFEFDTAQGAIPTYRPDWGSNDQEQAMLSTCSGLIAIVDNDGSRVVQFSHFSVKEFLSSNRLMSSLGDISRYHILLVDAHTILAQACLGCLLYLVDHMDDESTKGLPLAEYASEHWVTHAQFEDIAPRVKDGMVSLFDPDKPHFAAWFAQWVEIYLKGEPYPTFREFFSEMPTPFHYPSPGGSNDLVERSVTKLEHSQHENAMCGWYDFTLLAALRRKHFQVAEVLLMRGANVDIRGTRDQTLLHELIGDSDADRARFLLKQGVDVNAQQNDLSTPLHLAASNGNFTGALVLLEHGAEVDARNLEGKTPLCLLTEHNHFDIARLLLQHGADVNTRTKNQWTLLHLSALRGRLEISRALLDHGANAKAENNQGETPLHLVSRGNHDSQEDGVGIAKLLLERGADANARDNNYATPWLLARYRGKLDIAAALLYHDAKAPTENNSDPVSLRPGPSVDTNAQKKVADPLH